MSGEMTKLRQTISAWLSLGIALIPVITLISWGSVAPLSIPAAISTSPGAFLLVMLGIVLAAVISGSVALAGAPVYTGTPTLQRVVVLGVGLALSEAIAVIVIGIINFRVAIPCFN
jgi:hypothetical protein